jgi:hypothetical protein
MSASRVRALLRFFALAAVALSILGPPAPVAAQTALGLTIAVSRPSRAFEGISFGSLDASPARQIPPVLPDAPVAPVPRAQHAEEEIRCGIRVVSPPPSFTSNMPVHKADPVLDPKIVVNRGCSIRD